MAKILVVEDDSDLSALISNHFRGLQYSVDTCADGKHCLELVSKNHYNLIILDLGLPEMDGLDVCKEIRQKDGITPILMLTARDTEIDRVIGLEMGADDYLGKPFSIRELQARVKAILRRQHLLLETNKVAQQDMIRCRNLVINLSRRQVECQGHNVTLTAKEFELLFFLASNAGKVYSREQLLDQVWGYSNSYYEHTVNSNINRLRNKIESDSSKPEYIITVRGVGYKFDETMLGDYSSHV